MREKIVLRLSRQFASLVNWFFFNFRNIFRDLVLARSGSEVNWEAEYSRTQSHWLAVSSAADRFSQGARDKNNKNLWRKQDTVCFSRGEVYEIKPQATQTVKDGILFKNDVGFLRWSMASRSIWPKESTARQYPIRPHSTAAISSFTSRQLWGTIVNGGPSFRQTVLPTKEIVIFISASLEVASQIFN